MGLKNRANGNVKYLRIKDGHFYLSKDEEKQPFDELEGLVVDMFFKDEEYNGTPTRKLYLVTQDGDDKYILGLNFESSYCSKLLGFLANANLTKNLSIHSALREDTLPGGKEIKTTSLFVSQNGKYLKSAFTKDNPNGLPAMRKVKVGSKQVWDKEDMLKFFEDLVNRKFKPQLTQAEAPQPAAEKPWENDADNDNDDANDLPF